MWRIRRETKQYKPTYTTKEEITTNVYKPTKATSHRFAKARKTRKENEKERVEECLIIRNNNRNIVLRHIDDKVMSSNTYYPTMKM